MAGMENIEDYILGETEEEITLETSDHSRAISIQMINKCRRDLDIVSRDLDPCIYDTSEMLDAIKKLALRSRLSRIRILVLQPETLKSRGHRMLDLSERLSSFIKIRRVGKEHSSFNSAMLLVDECGFVRRPHSDRFEGRANFKDRKTVSDMQGEFDLLWNHSQKDPNFRRLSL